MRKLIRKPWLWLGLYGIALLTSLLVPANPRIVGLYHDDGTYWNLGTAILHDSYRDPHSPEPIQVAKYPPGVPLLAAAAQAVSGGDLPLGVSLLRALFAVLFVLTLGAYLSLLRTERGHAAKVAWLAVAAVALSPWFLDFLLVPMSEVPALFLVMVVLVRLVRPRGDGWREATLLALVCFGAVLFRSMALTLAAAAFVFLVTSGRRATAVRFATVFVPLFLALQVFMWAHERTASGFTDITVYGRPYSKLLMENLDHLPRIVGVNLLQSALFIAGVCVTGLVPAGFPSGGEVPWLWWGSALATAVLLGAALRRGGLLRPHRLFLALSGLLILVWPFESYRFWAFLLPFLLMELLNGAGALMGRWGATAVGVAAVGAALLTTIPERVVRTMDAYTFGGRTYSLRSTFEGVARLRGVLPENAVIACARDTFAGAHAGIRGVDGWATNQLFDRYYGPERVARTFFLQSDTVILVTRLFAVYPDVLAQYRRLGVTHVVQFMTIGDRVTGSLLGSLVQALEQEKRAELIYETADGDVRVWRVEP